MIEQQLINIFQQGCYEDLLNKLKRITGDKKTLTLCMLEAEALVRIGAISDGINLYKKLLKKYKRNAVLLNNYGLALTNQPEELQLTFALGYIEEAISIKPDYFEAITNKGVILSRLNRIEEALLSYDQAIQASQGNFAHAFFRKALLLRNLLRWREAELCINYAISLQPLNSEYKYLLIEAMLVGSKKNQAFELSKQLYEENNRDAKALYYLGITSYGLGLIEDSINYFKHALQIEPNQSDTLSALGLSLYKQMQFLQARRLIDQALTINSENITARLNLGLIDIYEQHYESALSHYEYVLKGGNNVAKVIANVNIHVLTFLQGKLVEKDWLNTIIPTLKSLDVPDVKQAKAYAVLINKLSNYWRTQIKAMQKEITKLHVIGESHILSLVNLSVPFKGNYHSCSVSWIIGIKQYHLGCDIDERKKGFINAISKIPHNSTLLLLIGEIDTRADEGIVAYCLKNEVDYIQVVAETAEKYVDFISKVTAEKFANVIIGGVAAPYYDPSVSLTEADYLRIKVIEKLNINIRKLSIKYGFYFLDLYSLTSNTQGLGEGQYFLDSWHLKPDTYQKAFYDFLLSPVEETMMKITIDSKEYLVEEISEAAKAQLANIQFVEQEINRHQAQLAVLNTAKSAYMNALRGLLQK